MKRHEPIPVGTEIVAYRGEPLFGVIERGPYTDLVHVTGTYDVRDAAGEVHQVDPSIIVTPEAFAGSWHVVKDRRIVAGGPGMTEARMVEFASENGGTVVHGWPAP